MHGPATTLYRETKRPSSHKQQWLIYLLACLSGVVAGVGLTFFYYLPLGHDQGWYLYVADVFLRGAKLYSPDLMETNPPFIIWLSAVPVLLGRLLHVASWTMLRVCLDLSIIGALIWTARLFRRLPEGRSSLRLWLLILAELVAMCFIARQYDVGQREHFLALTLLPYLFLGALRLEGVAVSAWESAAIGLVAGAGICTKPQQALVMIAVELVLVLGRRSLRVLANPAPWMIALAGALYLGAVEVFAHSYITEMVPLLRQVYWAYNQGTAVFFAAYRGILLAAAAAVIMFLVLRRQLGLRSLEWMLLAGGLAALVAFYIQHRFWTYQVVPASIFLFLGAAVMGIDLLTGVFGVRAVAARPAVAVACLTAVVTSFAATRVLKPREYDPVRATLDGIFATCTPGTPVYFMSIDIFALPGVLENHLVWSSRFPHLWMTPAIVFSKLGFPHTLGPAQVRELTELQQRELAEDFSRWRPELVVVDPCGSESFCEAMRLAGPPGGLVPWFNQRPAFAAEWAHYRLAKHLYRYDLYARRDATGYCAVVGTK